MLPTAAAAPMLKNGFEARLGCCVGRLVVYIPFCNNKRYHIQHSWLVNIPEKTWVNKHTHPSVHDGQKYVCVYILELNVQFNVHSTLYIMYI